MPLTFSKISKDLLPDHLHIAVSELDNEIVDVSEEDHSGSRLIKAMFSEFMGDRSPRLILENNKKPRAFLLKKEISVSFSHTGKAVSGVISPDFIVGIDMERADRPVSNSLVNRMTHEEENPQLYEKIAGIRIWTIKEAALKAIGTGLRTPMNSLIVNYHKNEHFFVQFSDGKRAKICSFQYKDYWISICYF